MFQYLVFQMYTHPHDANSRLFPTMKEAKTYQTQLPYPKDFKIQKVLTAKTTQEPRKVWVNGKLIELTVGVGATESFNSDSYPNTVWGWEVSAAGRVTVYITQDNYATAEGFDFYSKQVYDYTPNEPSETNTATAVILGTRNCRLHVGHRRFYQDPSF